MAKTWEQIIAEAGKVSDEQRRKDCNELLESMGMSWFDFMQTPEFHEIAEKISEARAARIVETLVDAHKKLTEAEAAKEAAEKTAEPAAEEKE